MNNLIQHTDFGEKIGGAKKDLCKQDGLCFEDLKKMNGREADKYVRKDNIWKKENYQALIDGGIPFDIVYFVKLVRDSIPTSPKYLREDDTAEKRLIRQKEYIDTIGEIRGILQNVKTKEDVLTVLSIFFINGGYIEKVGGGISGDRYQYTTKGNCNPIITNKMFRIMNIPSMNVFENKITRKAIKEQFGFRKDLKIPKDYDIQGSENTYSEYSGGNANTYYITRGSCILQDNFKTREDALSWIQKNKGINTGKKVRFTHPQLECIKRNGPDYRRSRDICGEEYLNEFGFRGGEFGNWMSQNDRQASLNYGYEALKDLAFALEIVDGDISFGGRLSIAFGSRGSGSAVAHYEPLRQVINLTKMHGAGSLAHEWWHGLDDYVGQKMGSNGYLSNDTTKYVLFSKLLNIIKYKSPQLISATCREETMFYQNSKKMDELYRKERDYWKSPVELTARAFATYIKDRLSCSSDYLVGHAECAIGVFIGKDGNETTINAYPEGEERIAINGVFDEIFFDLKSRGYFQYKY